MVYGNWVENGRWKKYTVSIAQQERDMGRKVPRPGPIGWENVKEGRERRELGEMLRRWAMAAS